MAQESYVLLAYRFCLCGSYLTTSWCIEAHLSRESKRDLQSTQYRIDIDTTFASVPTGGMAFSIYVCLPGKRPKNYITLLYMYVCYRLFRIMSTNNKGSKCQLWYFRMNQVKFNKILHPCEHKEKTFIIYSKKTYVGLVKNWAF